jgi:hypothetical protein
MRLEVRGMEGAAGKFVQLWGKYVVDFKSSTHCQDCLIGQPEKSISKNMTDGEIMLDQPMHYFYLFGMGRAPRRESNVHLAVRPLAGSTASVGSVYGAVFTIYDAQAIRVDRLPDGWNNLDPQTTQCRNFQFGVQMYGMKQPEKVS